MSRTGRIKRRAAAGFLVVLFISLALLFRSSFLNPPRSDYWSVLYVFHQVAASDEPLAWLAIVNHDPWQDGTYRPLAHPLLYGEHLLFGADFFWNHVVTFAGYCGSLIFLYLLARRLGNSRLLTAAFLAVYAFLFTHFDIVSWTFQIFIVLGFCACLAGIILYLDFLRTARAVFLLPAGGLFLFGLFCYEGFALWPGGLLILGDGRSLFPGRRPSPRSRYRPALPFLAAVYAFYIAGFFLTRSLEIGTGSLPRPSAIELLISVCAPFFNLAYNGLLVNACPFLALPLHISHNVEMRGLFWRWGLPLLARAVLVVGGAVLILILAVLRYLRAKNRRKPLVITAFLVFLYASVLFPTVLGRVITNDLYYPLVQFRYQYVPNALLVLLLAAAVTLILKPGRRGAAVLALLLLPVLVLNVILVGSTLEKIEDQLAPLRELVSYIRTGIEKGVINPGARVYIDGGVTARYPRLCWNREMAPYLEGTYQWMFPARDIGCFAFTLEEAVWITDAELGRFRDGRWQAWMGRRRPGTPAFSP